jgi:hypothetical protein
MRTLTPAEIDRIRLTCTTQAALVVAYLWYVEDWISRYAAAPR